MDANLKAAWLDGLRSGKYERSYGLLFTRDGAVCAVGVAFAVQGMTADDYYSRNCSYGPLRIPHGLSHTISAMNADGVPWSEIADYIVANVPVEPPKTDISVFTRMLDPRELVTGDIRKPNG